jgi:spermidine/putrescine transport system permease protein
MIMSIFSRKTLPYLIFIVPLIFVVVFLVTPYLITFSYSFFLKTYPTFKPDFQFQNYILIFTDPQYYQVFLRSFKIAISVTAISFLCAFPMAYYLVYVIKSARTRMILYFALILPLWMSYLLRGYIWKIILGTDGIVNSFLMWAGIIDTPSQIFLYNQASMVITFVYIFIPFMAMPIYASLEKIPKNLIEAAEDLGSSPLTTFKDVTLPLSMPGVIAGCTMTFCLTFGDFITPILVGGPNGSMIANVIQSQFGSALNWPLGAALSIMMLVIVLIVLQLSQKLDQNDRLEIG